MTPTSDAGTSPPAQRASAAQTATVVGTLLETVPTIQLIIDPTVGDRIRVDRPQAPREAPPSPPGSPPTPADGLPHGGNGFPEPPIEIVLIDDVEGIRRLVRIALEDSDWFAVQGEASDGRTGIQVVKEHQPDLVLLDLSMPGMDGLEALPSILEVSPESRVAIYSGFKADRLETTARELGAIGYLEKGLTPDELVEELVALLKT